LADAVIVDSREKNNALPLLGHDSNRRENVDTTYYDTLPDRVGTIIPPGQNRPIKVWTGLLVPVENLEQKFHGRERDKGKISDFLYFWYVGLTHLFQWKNIQANLSVQVAPQSVVEWYQYWDDIPYKIVKNSSSPFEECTFDFLVKIDPDPILKPGWKNTGTPGEPGPPKRDFGEGFLPNGSNWGPEI